MGRTIIKIKDKFFEWSTIVDAPVTYGMDENELRSYIKDEYGNAGLEDLPKQLQRVQEKGASWHDEDYDLEQTVMCNRAGENESCISLDEIYERYTATR